MANSSELLVCDLLAKPEVIEKGSARPLTVDDEQQNFHCVREVFICDYGQHNRFRHGMQRSTGLDLDLAAVL